MAASSTPYLSKSPVLNSCKEIASYLGRGVRTVQRYERELHLPVRRFAGKSHASVVALPSDLDAWLEQAALGQVDAASRARAELSPVRASIVQSESLRRQCRELRMTNHQELENLIANLSALCREFKERRSATIEKHPPTLAA